MKVDLDALERKARSALDPHGRAWKIDGLIPEEQRWEGAPVPRWVGGVEIDGVTVSTMSLEIAVHIAENSPPVTLALVARLRELEIALDHASVLCRSEDARAFREILERGAVLP